MIRPKVLFVINSLHGGGAEQVMATLLAHSEARARNYDVSIALLDRDEIAFPPPPWVRVHQLDCRFETLRSCIALRRLIRAQRPDITVSFLTRSNLACGIAMAERRRPWIVSERTNTTMHSGRGIRGRLTRAVVGTVYPFSSRVIAVSKGVATSLEGEFGVASSKIQVIANPLDLGRLRAAAEESAPIPIEGPFTMALGRLAAVKNYRLLLEAFARSGLPGRLLIAGEGPERCNLVQTAQRLGIGERVVLPGFLNNPYPLLRRARAFALTSNAEGFPNALLEALALGVPVVATNCHDGPAEIIAFKGAGESHGIEVGAAGILTPVGDVGRFAEALGMVQLEPIRRALITSGLERAKAFSPETAVAAYWAIIDEALRPTMGRSQAHVAG